MSMKKIIGGALMTFITMIGLSGGVVGQNPYWIAFYGFIFALGTWMTFE